MLSTINPTKIRLESILCLCSDSLGFSRLRHDMIRERAEIGYRAEGLCQVDCNYKWELAAEIWTDFDGDVTVRVEGTPTTERGRKSKAQTYTQCRPEDSDGGSSPGVPTAVGGKRRCAGSITGPLPRGGFLKANHCWGFTARLKAGGDSSIFAGIRQVRWRGNTLTEFSNVEKSCAAVLSNFGRTVRSA